MGILTTIKYNNGLKEFILQFLYFVIGYIVYIFTFIHSVIFLSVMRWAATLIFFLIVIFLSTQDSSNEIKSTDLGCKWTQKTRHSNHFGLQPERSHAFFVGDYEKHPQLNDILKHFAQFISLWASSSYQQYWTAVTMTTDHFDAHADTGHRRSSLVAGCKSYV